jgi:hypothetical protein
MTKTPKGELYGSCLHQIALYRLGDLGHWNFDIALRLGSGW